MPCQSAPCSPIDAASLACLTTQVRALDQRTIEFNERISILEDLAGGSRLAGQGVFCFVADQGDHTAEAQQRVALAFQLENANGYIFGGDNQYSGFTASAWENFNDIVDAGKAYPVFGNHDYDVSDGLPLREKFSDLFKDGKDYYDVEFDDGDVHVFFLTNGFNSDEELVSEAGDTAIGGAQYNWFIEKLRESKRRWKIVVMHHPIVSLHTPASSNGPYCEDWGLERLGVHLVLCGHEHQVWHVRRNGLDWLNVSTGSQTARPFQRSVGSPGPPTAPEVLSDPSLIHNGSAGTYCVWADTSAAGMVSQVGVYAKIFANDTNLSYKLINAFDNSTVRDTTIIR